MLSYQSAAQPRQILSRSLALPVAVAAAMLVAACVQPIASSSELDRFRGARAALSGSDTAYLGMRGRYALYRVRLASETGLVVSGRLLSPATQPSAPNRSEEARRFPAVLLNDGRELDSRAIDFLPDEFGDVVVLSLDYPSELPYAMQLSDVLMRGGRLRVVAEQVPASFVLGGRYLAERSDVDSARIAIAATSFAVPFAVIAAAADERFRNVALVYGAGDLESVIAANLAMRPSFLRTPAAWLASRPFRTLQPERYIPHIAPRSVVMVNGIDDPQMPRSAVEALFEAANEPKELVWLRTGHLSPFDTALIRTLVDTALARLPVLGGAAAPDSTDAGATTPDEPLAASAPRARGMHPRQ